MNDTSKLLKVHKSVVSLDNSQSANASYWGKSTSQQQPYSCDHTTTNATRSKTGPLVKAHQSQNAGLSKTLEIIISSFGFEFLS